jgi:hypothetical protein
VHGVRTRTGRTKPVVALVSAACLLSACSNPAISKAVGGVSDGDTAIVVHAAESAVIIENHAGRPLLNVRITIAAADAAKPFILVVPTMDAGATSELALTGFRSEDATMLDPTAVHPTQVAVTARDTLAKTYAVTVPWKP